MCTCVHAQPCVHMHVQMHVHMHMLTPRCAMRSEWAGGASGQEEDAAGRLKSHEEGVPLSRSREIDPCVSPSDEEAGQRADWRPVLCSWISDASRDASRTHLGSDLIRLDLGLHRVSSARSRHGAQHVPLARGRAYAVHGRRPTCVHTRLMRTRGWRLVYWGRAPALEALTGCLCATCALCSALVAHMQ